MAHRRLPSTHVIMTCRGKTEGTAEGSSAAVMDAIAFASCYVYSPGGCGVGSERSRLMRCLLKARNAYFMQRYAQRVRWVNDHESFDGIFRSSSILVPIPGSEPQPCGGHSVASTLAAALHREGLGNRVWHGLCRASPVRKSATAAPGSRPTVADHYSSFAILPAQSALLASALRPQLAQASTLQILLVDDVVTKGRTLLAAAARMRAAFPTADIRAFALLRTMGLVERVDHLLDPCVGMIEWRRGDAYRMP